ncbi:hypothetical protein D3C73_1547440 [compost metagenome]
MRACTLVAELANHQLQRVEGGNHGTTHAAHFVRSNITGEVGIAVADRFTEPASGRANHHGRQASWPENRADHGCADNPQADFLGT